MKERPGHPPSRTVTDNLATQWERRGTPNDVRLAEAKKQQGQRILEIASFVRLAVRENPHLASLLAIMSGADFDSELLEANAAKVVEDPLTVELFVQIERIIAERTPVYAHEDLPKLREMIDQLMKKA